MDANPQQNITPDEEIIIEYFKEKQKNLKPGIALDYSKGEHGGLPFRLLKEVDPEFWELSQRVHVKSRDLYQIGDEIPNVDTLNKYNLSQEAGLDQEDTDGNHEHDN